MTELEVEEGKLHEVERNISDMSVIQYLVLVHRILLLTIATNIIVYQVTAFKCTNVALNKTVTATTPNAVTRSTQQTNGMIDFNCLPDHKMTYPEVVLDFEEETEISFLHIFLKKHMSTQQHKFHLRVGFRSWGDLEVGVKTRLSPLDMICSEYNNWTMSAIITIHCRHYAKSRYLVIQGIGNMNLPICEIKAYSDGNCENLALGKTATTSDVPRYESSISYPMTAVDGYKYELQKCVIFDLVSQKSLLINLGQDYTVAVVNIYHQSFDCIVNDFTRANGRKRQPINYYAFFNVSAAMCKWLCEGDASCTGVDVDSSASLPECYLHNKQADMIYRLPSGAVSYTFFKADRICQQPVYTQSDANNYAYKHSSVSQYGRYLPHNVTMSITVQDGSPRHYPRPPISVSVFLISFYPPLHTHLLSSSTVPLPFIPHVQPTLAGSSAASL
ncbi:hypothetical protein LSAT2_031640 [Lamellibrachia satsuma]|nr:hypothetical protein LSAT2_031640 [Lamellibrachia satsuma]